MEMSALAPVVAAVPRLWPDCTMIILAAGPSLTASDIAVCRGKARVLAIKQCMQLAPWADAGYACDARFWRHYGPSLRFGGPTFALEDGAAPWATVLRQGLEGGLSTDPTTLNIGRAVSYHGTNSGAQAINLAYLLGASKIVLLGYDNQFAPNGASHCFGEHPWRRRPQPALWTPIFESIAAAAPALNLTIVNASRTTDLRCFPRLPLEQVLDR